MIEPPTLHSEARQEYDIMDLELLGKIAIELSVHSHPVVKRSFEKLVDSVGTKRFGEDYCALERFLMKLHHQAQLNNEFAYFYQQTGKSGPPPQPASSSASSAAVVPPNIGASAISTVVGNVSLPRQTPNTNTNLGLTSPIYHRHRLQRQTSSGENADTAASGNGSGKHGNWLYGQGARLPVGVPRAGGLRRSTWHLGMTGNNSSETAASGQAVGSASPSSNGSSLLVQSNPSSPSSRRSEQAK